MNCVKACLERNTDQYACHHERYFLPNPWSGTLF